jgi:hypothetical protein
MLTQNQGFLFRAEKMLTETLKFFQLNFIGLPIHQKHKQFFGAMRA